MRTLPSNSTNDVVPGGPVSSVAGRNEIFFGVENRKRIKCKIDMNEVGNCRCQGLCRRCRDGAQNFTALGSDGLWLRLGRLGMKRTTALRRIGFCGNRAKRAMIGNRDPGADGNRDDHPARCRTHIDSIVDVLRTLKCFLLDR